MKDQRPMTFHLPAILHKELGEVAREEMLSKAALLRRLIKEYIEKQKLRKA